MGKKLYGLHGSNSVTEIFDDSKIYYNHKDYDSHYGVGTKVQCREVYENGKKVKKWSVYTEQKVDNILKDCQQSRDDFKKHKDFSLTAQVPLTLYYHMVDNLGIDKRDHKAQLAYMEKNYPAFKTTPRKETKTKYII